MSNKPRMVLFCVSAMVLALAGSSPLLAQGMATEKPMPAGAQQTVKTIAENGKVLVQELSIKPGETAPMMKRPMRVVYFVSGGTVVRTFDDGKTETVTYKSGETRILDIPRGYSYVNSGKTTIRGISVSLK
jgi:hypothetical protein